MMHYGYGYMGYGLFFQLLIFAVFFAVLWWLLKEGSHRSREEPIAILKKRLARGDITRKEFEELKKEIE
ncbi:SHOCT domain-containing protein [Candidatus Woesearchaeota archaeon]|nr:SHOCT domain-containing protein [Candidatus Woesearchaeota archaeon]